MIILVCRESIPKIMVKYKINLKFQVIMTNNRPVYKYFGIAYYDTCTIIIPKINMIITDMLKKCSFNDQIVNLFHIPVSALHHNLQTSI